MQEATDNVVDVHLVSALQERILRTLDTLDTAEIKHQEELHSMLADRRNLQEKLSRAERIVQDIQSERDDMRDAVMRLVEKVELCNDYSHWPHSSMVLSCFAEPLSLPSTPATGTEEIISDAAATIAILRKQRDDEKMAHKRSRDTAAATIVSLEARICRREAELEIRNFTLGLSGHSRPDGSLTHLRDPPDDLVSMLETTTARNRSLENEVRVLARRLEKAKHSRSHSARRSGSNQLHGPNPDEDRHPEASASSHPRSWLAFESEIRDFATQIDGLTNERRAALKTIEQDLLMRPLPQDASKQAQDMQDRVASLERECESLRNAQTILKEELDAVNDAALRRENELLLEIAALRADLDDKTRIATTRERAQLHIQAPTGPSDLLDEGETSMELATPLLPIPSISTRSPVPLPRLQDILPDSITTDLGSIHISRSTSSDASDLQDEQPESPYLDPPSIPLPPSPDGLSEWEENSPTFSQFTPS